MEMTRRLKPARLFVAAVLLVVLGIVTYAFTAANTVPATKAGDGSGAITGYIITNVSYTLNGTDPSRIDAVTFDLDSIPPAGSTIKIQLDSVAADWYDCTNFDVNITCDTTSPQAMVLPADALRVLVVP
jgi:hypothetical protein